MITVCRLNILLLCFIIILGMMQGCGKKADPKPPDVPPPKAISDLKTNIEGSGVYLRWSIPETKGVIQKFKIQRSDLDKGKASCIDCPREFVIIADIAMNNPALRKEDGNIVGYLDLQVTSGYMYMYRVITCDTSGNCSEPSNVGEITIGAESQKSRKGVGAAGK